MPYVTLSTLIPHVIHFTYLHFWYECLCLQTMHTTSKKISYLKRTIPMSSTYRQFWHECLCSWNLTRTTSKKISYLTWNTHVIHTPSVLIRMPVFTNLTRKIPMSSTYRHFWHECLCSQTTHTTSKKMSYLTSIPMSSTYHQFWSVLTWMPVLTNLTHTTAKIWTTTFIISDHGTQFRHNLMHKPRQLPDNRCTQWNNMPQCTCSTNTHQTLHRYIK